MAGGLLEAREDTPIVFDLAKEAFDQMPLLIDMAVVFPRLGAVLAGRDHCRGTACPYRSYERIGIVALIRNHGLVGQQRLGLRDVRRLPARKLEVQRVAQGIGQRLNLGAEAASGAPQGFGLRRAFLAPAAQACARTMVLSKKTSCKSGSWATC